MTWLLGERGPAGRRDAANYLLDSVNRSHGDWANLSTVPFVSRLCQVPCEPLGSVRCRRREYKTANTLVLGLREVMYTCGVIEPKKKQPFIQANSTSKEK